MQTKTVDVHIRLSEEERDKIKEMAEKEKLPLTTYARQQLLKLIEKNKQ